MSIVSERWISETIPIIQANRNAAKNKSHAISIRVGDLSANIKKPTSTPATPLTTLKTSKATATIIISTAFN